MKPHTVQLKKITGQFFGNKVEKHYAMFDELSFIVFDINFQSETTF